MKRTSSLFSLIACLLLAIGIVPAMSTAQPASITSHLYNNKTGVGWVITTGYDTVDAQSGAVTRYITLPTHKDSLFYGGDWDGMLWLEIDTLAGNLTQHDVDFYIEESPASGGATNFVTALNRAGSAAQVTTTPSLAPGIGSAVRWVLDGLRNRLNVTVTDGVIRYRFFAVIHRKNDPRY